MTGIKISVERLQVGNYVSLPLGWREHPFLFSSFKLKSEDYLRVGEAIAGAGLPTVFVFEGGYAVEEVGVNAVNVLEGFAQGR